MLIHQVLIEGELILLVILLGRLMLSLVLQHEGLELLLRPVIDAERILQIYTENLFAESLTINIYLIYPLSVILSDLTLTHDSFEVGDILGEVTDIIAVDLDLCNQVELLPLTFLRLKSRHQVSGRQLRKVRHLYY